MSTYSRFKNRYFFVLEIQTAFNQEIFYVKIKNKTIIFLIYCHLTQYFLSAVSLYRYYSNH
jgi:hypothetical protein